HLACEVLRAPIAFHPAARALARRIAAEREMACDELAVERLVAPRACAGALLALVARPPPSPAGVGRRPFPAGTLQERMERSVDRRARRGAAAARTLYLAALASLLAACALASSFVAGSVGIEIARAADPGDPPPGAAADVPDRVDPGGRLEGQ